MPISHISFLQLGDVHYPELLTEKPLADHKDQGLSTAQVSAVSSSRIAEITRGIIRARTEEKNLVAVVLTGDLTAREVCLDIKTACRSCTALFSWTTPATGTASV